MSEYKDFLNHFKGKMINSQENDEPTAQKVSEEARQIKSVPVVHTSKNSQVHIPDSSSEEIFEADAPRFIKTGTTPFVSVSGHNDSEEEPTDVEKFTDRLSNRAKEKKKETVTASSSGYAQFHAADDGTQKFMKPQKEDENVEVSADDNAPEEDLADDKTKVITVSEEFGDILEESGSPTKYIDPSKGSLLREIALTANDDIRHNPDQLMMEGFNKEEEEAEKARLASLEEEKKLEQELSEVRKKRVNNFHFWNKQETAQTAENTDEKFSADAEKTSLPQFLKPVAEKFSEKFSHLNSDFTPIDHDEFEEFESRKNVFTKLLQTRRQSLIQTAVVALLGIVLFIINTVASVSAANNNGFFTIFGGSNTIFVAVNLIILLLCALMMIRELKNGLFSLLKVHPKADTSLLFMIISAFVQTVASFFTQLKIEENYHLYTASIILLCVPYLLGKIFYYDNIRHCFKAAGAKSEKSYLRRISDEETLTVLLRDKQSTDKNVVYSGKTKFISNFLRRSEKSAYSGMPSSRTVVLCIGVSVITGIIAWIIKGSFVYGISAVALCSAFSFPVSCLTATGFFISNENKKLSLKTSFVHSYADARDFAAVDDIVINADDIFEAKINNVFTSKGINDKQALFCAAVLTNSAGGPVANAFKSKVSNLEDRFPKVDDYVYEDKLGHSAWVQNCRVLLGSNTFLINHNVQTPDENAALRFLAENEKPLYLSLEGRFAAMFAVEYTCNSLVTENLRSLVNTGANVLLSSSDPNITEEYAEKILHLPEGSVRIISPSANEKLNSAKSAVSDSEDAGIVFSSSFDSLCRCAAAALRLDRAKKLSKLVCEGGAFVGSLLCFVLVVTGAFSKTAAVMPTVLQLVWLILCFAVPLALSKTAMDKTAKSIHTVSTKNAAASSDNTETVETPDQENEENGEPQETQESQKNTETQTFEDQQTQQSNAKENKININSVLSGVKALASSFASKTSHENENEDENEAEEEISESHEKQSENEFAKFYKASSSFSLFNDFSERRKKKTQQELDEEQKEISESLHFTPPEMPERPVFDFKEEQKSEDPLEAKFTPPADTTPISVYDDELFKTYEDDNIFAGLKEENKKKFIF